MCWRVGDDVEQRVVKKTTTVVEKSASSAGLLRVRCYTESTGLTPLALWVFQIVVFLVLMYVNFNIFLVWSLAVVWANVLNICMSFLFHFVLFSCTATLTGLHNWRFVRRCRVDDGWSAGFQQVPAECSCDCRWIRQLCLSDPFRLCFPAADHLVRDNSQQYDTGSRQVVYHIAYMTAMSLLGNTLNTASDCQP